jgi:hypothetical protein
MKYDKDYLEQLDVWKDSKGFWNASVLSEGKTVGFASFTYDYIPSEDETHLVEGDLKGWELLVASEHRRKKIATCMYNEIQKQSGKKILPSFLTPEGSKFREFFDKIN